MNNQFSETFQQAAREYLWLLNRSYPQNTSLKLVGDKFRLTGSERQVLYRGISAEIQAKRRKGMIGAIVLGDTILVDTYNVLFTVNNYLLGRPVFICNDGILRDAGEMRGRIVSKPVFTRSIGLFMEVLAIWQGARFILYLDEPVPFSGRLSVELSNEMLQKGIDGEARTVRSPDYMLKHGESDGVCTSDTAIIDHYYGRITDLPKFLLEKYFSPEFPSLASISSL
jgi:hypothetical protein